jgi:hypothetical protein
MDISGYDWLLLGVVDCCGTRPKVYPWAVFHYSSCNAHRHVSSLWGSCKVPDYGIGSRNMQQRLTRNRNKVVILMHSLVFCKGKYQHARSNQQHSIEYIESQTFSYHVWFHMFSSMTEDSKTRKSWQYKFLLRNIRFENNTRKLERWTLWLQNKLHPSQNMVNFSSSNKIKPIFVLWSAVNHSRRSVFNVSQTFQFRSKRQNPTPQQTTQATVWSTLWPRVHAHTSSIVHYYFLYTFTCICHCSKIFYTWCVGNNRLWKQRLRHEDKNLLLWKMTMS